MKVEVQFMPNDRVQVDNEITGYVIEVSIGIAGTTTYKVEWFNNGGLCCGWFIANRLTLK